MATTVNIPLQQRAGHNIGNQGTFPFTHGAGSREIAVNVSGATVLMEGRDKVVRTPCLGAELANFGFIFNSTATSYDYTVVFVDDLGNEIEIGGDTVAGGAAYPLNLGDAFANGQAFVGLCPGEKIVLRMAVTPPDVQT